MKIKLLIYISIYALIIQVHAQEQPSAFKSGFVPLTQEELQQVPSGEKVTPQLFSINSLSTCC